MSLYPVNRPPLKAEALIPLPLGSVKPLGWLLDQCRVQANGLTGHLEEFWPDVGPDSMWLGGETEGWERGPYYLDGLIALAYVLDDDRLKAMAKRWTDSILGMQTADGWIGPVQALDRKPYDQWPVAIVLKALTQHFEATGDERVLTVMTGFARYLKDTLDERPLFDWGQHRWADLAISLLWLYRQTGEAWIADVADTVRKQGYDWRDHFENFRYTVKTPPEDCTRDNHVVNSAMAVKSGGTAWSITGDDGDRASVYRTMEMLDEYHGQVTGVFTGDEHYAGKDPSQGTELCAVVEYMYSLELLTACLGDPAFGDRLERIAYNALPATFTPDMWAHQYDQQVNQVLCTVAPRQWTNNLPDSNTYGLEPNFGCCTANYHQGWPKLVAHMWMATLDGGLAVVAYGPSVVKAKVAGGVDVTISETTAYPFAGSIRLTVSIAEATTFPLLVRVPAWVKGASITVNGTPLEDVKAGTYHRIEREWKDKDVVDIYLPIETRVERRYHNAASIVRGPLVFALQMGEEFRKLKGEEPHADWEVFPTTPWNYALDVKAGFTTETRPLGPVPFAPESAPVVLHAKAKRLPGWDLVENSAGPLPQSPVTSEEPLEDVLLIPYGSTNLRIGEFPTL
ncbi:MAG TPA: beta-L-arabinofuranosidase domain-containing protein [Armatimonadota bacterium]|jgi:DUF1680 family protein